jgi:hypothetical protein
MSFKSFERTRSAAASGFAGLHLWRAAQLRIRYAAMAGCLQLKRGRDRYSEGRT